MEVDAITQEWIKSEADERAALAGYWFDLPEAQRWVDLIEKVFVHTMNGPCVRAGDPYKLLDWQKLVLMQLKGWKRDRSKPHLRRYKKGDVFIGKKQGKSSFGGVLADTELLTGGPRTEVYGVAHTREQASIIYREAEAQATKAPQLRKRLKVLDSTKRIIYKETNSFYAVLAGENGARSVEGVIPRLILFDEIHVQRDRKFYDALAHACIASENSLFLSLSTVGVADETTIWWEQYEYAKGILSGTITDHERFAYIAQADEDCIRDPVNRMDPEQWRKAMPALNITVPEENVRAAVVEAENSPAKMNALLRYIFNIPTAQVDRVIPLDKWALCKWDSERGEFPELLGRVCYGGLDVASSEDLTAVVLYFPPLADEERGYLKTYFWCPEAKIRERELKHLAHYANWLNAGWLQKTGGARIDHATILRFLQECTEKYRLKEVGYDKWNADAIVNPMDAEYPEMMVNIEQSFTGMAGPSKTFMDHIIEGKLWHDGNLVMTWCCENASAETYDADTWKFSKKTSKEKVDGVIAGAMAVHRGSLGGAEDDCWNPADGIFL